MRSPSLPVVARLGRATAELGGGSIAVATLAASRRPVKGTGCAARRAPGRERGYVWAMSATWPMTRSSVPSSRQPSSRLRPFSPMAGVIVTS